MTRNPKLSIVLIVYKMPRQALNTIYSLSINHQKNVRETDYEIIVVENLSSDNLDGDAVCAIGNNIRYFPRNETSASPVGAINFGIEQCRAPAICLMIDGARMVTPRVIEYALMARNIDQDFLLAVPGYNIGPHEHQYNISRQYDQETEKRLLETVKWKTNGYRLFDICNISGANEKGIFHPLLECNCMFSSAQNFERIGGANMDFQLPGGGSINLHMFRQLGMLKQTRYYFITPGEGSFHQFHGGITTQEAEDREEVLESHRKQLHSYWEGGFHAMRREPILLGAVGSKAQSFLHYSSKKARKRFGWMRNGGKHPWIDDFNLFASANFNT
ncbi:MAG: glycosyltransferase [Pseudomonadales bacterium]|nr:glycosyltransferase [Pseudomonadales bacterium]